MPEDEDNNEVGYESGPFCRHYGDPGECEEVCAKCGGKLLLTVNKGGIQKYLTISKEIAQKYGLSDYLKQRLGLVEKDLALLFPSEKNQHSLSEFM